MNKSPDALNKQEFAFKLIMTTKLEIVLIIFLFWMQIEISTFKTYFACCAVAVSNNYYVASFVTRRSKPLFTKNL